MWPAMIAMAAAMVWAVSSRRAGYTASFGSIRSRILFLALCLALLIFLNPEVRVLLLAIEAVGVDAFLLLVLIQLQVGFAFARRAWLEDLRYSLCRWGPLLPHWRTLTNSAVIFLLPIALGVHYLSR